MLLSRIHFIHKLNPFTFYSGFFFYSFSLYFPYFVYFLSWLFFYLLLIQLKGYTHVKRTSVSLLSCEPTNSRKKKRISFFLFGGKKRISHYIEPLCDNRCQSVAYISNVCMYKWNNFALRSWVGYMFYRKKICK